MRYKNKDGNWAEAYLPSKLDGGNSTSSSLYSGKTIAIIGDSISSFEGFVPDGNEYYYYPNRTLNMNVEPFVTSYSQMYWALVRSALGANQVGTVNGWSGSRVTATRSDHQYTSAGCLDRCKELGTDPDVIIVFLGTNDFGNSVPLGTYTGNANGTVPNSIPQLAEDSNGKVNLTASADTISALNEDFRLAYAVMLDRIHQKYPYAEVWCCTLPSFDRGNAVGGTNYPEYNSAGVSINQYNDAIRDIAAFCGCGIIELSKCLYNHYNLPSMAQDYGTSYEGFGLHPNVYGHSAIANEIIRTLDPSCTTRYSVR